MHARNKIYMQEIKIYIQEKKYIYARNKKLFYNIYMRNQKVNI